MSKIITLTLATLIATLVISGCYTILQHPDSEANYSSEDYQADCTGCHAEYHEYPYGYFYGNYPDYWWSNPRWGRYYAYPWWWDNYWYNNNYHHSQSSNNDDDLSPRSTRGEKVERRESLRPPYSFGTTNISRSDGSTGNIGTGGTTSKQNQQPTVNPDNTQVKKTKEKEEEKQENKKTPRRGGGRSR